MDFSTEIHQNWNIVENCCCRVSNRLFLWVKLLILLSFAIFDWIGFLEILDFFGIDSFTDGFLQACGCVCGRGHLRKDLDWIAPKRTEHLTEGEGRKKNRNNLKKSLTNSGCPSTSASSPASAACKVNNNSTAAHLLNGLRYRANSLSSTGSASSGSSSPPELVQSSASIGTSLFFKRRANSNINGVDAERERLVFHIFFFIFIFFIFRSLRSLRSPPSALLSYLLSFLDLR